MIPNSRIVPLKIMYKSQMVYHFSASWYHRPHDHMAITFTMTHCNPTEISPTVDSAFVSAIG
jgi:hypothetical protein